MTMAHHIVRCREHLTVYENCRCTSPDKRQVYVDCHCTPEQEQKASAPSTVGTVVPGSTALPATFSTWVVFARVNALWRYEGMFFGDESAPVRQRIKALVEEENGAGSYWEAQLP